MPTYTVIGVEHVYDAFDEYEHANRISVKVQAYSVCGARRIGDRALRELVQEQRRDFLASGSFDAQLIRILDEDGYIVFQSRDIDKEGLRIFGGDLEDHRLGPVYFLSYSHVDGAFGEKLHADITALGLRLWRDRNDQATEAELCKKGHRPSTLEGTLRAAIGRAEKTLLVLSHSSVGSYWVKHEIAIASAVERDRKCEVLVPLMLEEIAEAELRDALGQQAESRKVYDFTKWRKGRMYRRQLTRLLYDVFRYKLNWYVWYRREAHA